MPYTKKELNKLALAKLHCEHVNAKWQRRGGGEIKTLFCPDCEKTLKIERGYGLSIDFTEKSLINNKLTFNEIQTKIDRVAKSIANRKGLIVVNRETKGVGLIDIDEEDE